MERASAKLEGSEADLKAPDSTTNVSPNYMKEIGSMQAQLQKSRDVTQPTTCPDVFPKYEPGVSNLPRGQGAPVGGANSCLPVLQLASDQPEASAGDHTPEAFDVDIETPSDRSGELVIDEDAGTHTKFQTSELKFTQAKTNKTSKSGKRTRMMVASLLSAFSG